jgi:hypothetical protein
MTPKWQNANDTLWSILVRASKVLSGEKETRFSNQIGASKSHTLSHCFDRLSPV